MMNIIFVTMMYGVGLPILFPLACISFAIIYFTEVFMLYYIYKRPPAFEEGLNIDALKSVVRGKPDVLAHNNEAVRRVFKRVRPGGNYDVSLQLLKTIKEMLLDV